MIVYDLELDTLIRQRGEILNGSPLTNDRDPANVNTTGITLPETQNPDPGTPLPDAPLDPSGDQDLAVAFRSALNDFLGAVAGLNGGTLDKRMEGALNSLLPHAGVFNPDTVTPLKAPLVLEVIDRARIDRKKKVRALALETVKHLYDRNHELLRKCGIEDKVQSCYRRLGE